MSVRPTVPAWVDLDQLAALDPDDDLWRPQMACGDEPMRVFFPPDPPRGGRYDYTAAAQVCARCPVRLPCLASWLPTVSPGPDGQSGCYVGGCTPAERTAVRLELRARKAAA